MPEPVEIYDIAPDWYENNFYQLIRQSCGSTPALFVNLDYDPVKKEWQEGLENYQELSDLVSRRADEGASVVMYSFLPLRHFTADPRFFGLLGYKRAEFVRLPQSLDYFRQLVEQLREKPNIKDELAAFYATDFANRGTKIRRLLHGLEPHKMGTDIAKNAVIGINEAFGTAFNPGTEQAEAQKYLAAYEPDVKNRFANQRLAGVFCDVDGTFIDAETGNVNPNVLRALLEYDKNTFVHLWSGGTDEAKLRQMLSMERKPWMILSKRDFRGTYPDIVIDDMSKEQFEQTYGIKPTAFIHADELR